MPKGRVVGERRRLAAIMFTDIVGYTALTQSNEAQALEILERHNQLVRPLLEKHRGNEIKTIGDSFLVEFESALDASICAVEIQEFFHKYNATQASEWKIRLRIGIHLGDVVQKENDIFGDAVNIASRIQPLAEPDGVCVTEQVFYQVRNKMDFTFEKLSEPGLKNVKFPTEVYKIVMPWDEVEMKNSSAPLDRHRIAILPLVNMISDPKDEYFADGLTEEMISTVSKVSGLSTISRTSVMQYKNAAKRIGDIGRDLNVGTILEGSVRKAGNKVRIAVQLIEVESDKHLWAENYDRDLEDVFSIQSDIAEKVAGSLKVKLLDSELENIRKAATTDPEAHALYLKGRYFWNERTRDSEEKALEYFRLATEKDPSFALAYCGIADCYVILVDHLYYKAANGLPKGLEAARKALSLDPALAEAHNALGSILQHEWQFEASEKEFRIALELNPNYATAHHWYAVALTISRKNEESLRQIRRAIELDPLSLQMKTFQASLIFEDKKYELAIAELKKVLEIAPNYYPAKTWLGSFYRYLGRYEESISILTDAVKQNDTPSSKGRLASAYASAGLKKEALEILDELRRLSETDYVAPMSFVDVYGELGMKDEAFAWLEKAYEERDSAMIYLNLPIWLRNLRSDPRFDSMIKRVGLLG